jgi:gliding motility-associated-like protein
MKRIFIIAVLFIMSGGLMNFGYGQHAPTCGVNVPYFVVDLRGHPDSIWESPRHSRLDTCCGAPGNFTCTSYKLILDTGAAGVNFTIATGAIPSGVMYYQVDCGTQVPVGDIICIPGGGVHYVTFCKPGNNTNTYRITSISKPIVPRSDTTRVDCHLRLKFMGFDTTTVAVTSINPGTTGQYNKYLSCTSKCVTPVFSPDSLAPAYIDYVVSGYPYASMCGYILKVYDTIRLYTLSKLRGYVTPNPGTFCSSGSGVLLTAHGSGGDGRYKYIWKDSTLHVVSTGSTYLANVAGTYTLEVRDSLYSGTCAGYFASVPVIVTQQPTADAGPDKHKCASNPATDLNGSVSHATGGIWSGGAGTYSTSKTDMHATYTPTVSEIKTGFVTLTLKTTGAGGGCTNDSDKMTIFFNDTVKISLSAPSLLCHDSKVAITPVVTGGTSPYYYLWGNGEKNSSITAGEGTWCLNITDNIGCTQVQCITMKAPPALKIVITSTDVSSNGGSDGTATATVSGGTKPYAYYWNNEQTSSTSTGLPYGVDTVIVVDSNGCTTQASVVVNEPRCSGFSGSVSTWPIKCYGDNNDSAKALPSGGTAPYSYAWSDASHQSTQVAKNLGAGSYSVLITDSNGCMDVVILSITQPQQLTNTITHVDVLVKDESTGSATANPIGGTSPYSYLWNGGQTTKTISGLKSGYYKVIITDANGCSISDSIHINQPPCYNFNIYTNAVPVKCNGDKNGKAFVVISHGTPPFTYYWNTLPAQTTDTAKNLYAGTYSVTVTDSVHCSNFQTITVPQPDKLSIKLASTDIICHGSNNGTIELSVSGGTFPYTYSWSNGMTVEDLINLAPGTYNVTVTDANGCTATGSATVHEPSALSSTFIWKNVTCFGGSDGSINATLSGGIIPYTYSWSNTAVTKNIAGLPKGYYVLKITDANGCKYTSASILVDEPNTVSVAKVAVACPDPSTGLAGITITPAGGNGQTYSVSLNNGASYQTAGLYTFSVAANASYNIRVKDSLGCTSPSATTVNVNAVVRISNINFDSCLTSRSATVNVQVHPAGGNGGPYRVSYDNGSTWQTLGSYTYALPINASYYVMAKDTLGCLSLPFRINIPDTISQSSVLSDYNTHNIRCKGGNDGSITLSVSGGKAPYTYAWTGPGGYTATTKNISGLHAGTYHVTITDSNGCKKLAQFTLTEPSQLEAGAQLSNYYGHNVKCNGSNEGSIILTVSGGTPNYSYMWTGPASYTASTKDVSGLYAGFYKVTITDANGCSLKDSFTLTEPAALKESGVISSFTNTNIKCQGSTEGAITLTVSGGTPNYSYAWTGPGSFSRSTKDLTDLSSGTYKVTVYDANGCFVKDSFSLTEPNKLTDISDISNYNGHAIKCNGDHNGSISLTISGGTPGYSYVWSGPGSYSANTKNVSGLYSGFYKVTITDTNGCSIQDSFTLTQPSQLSEGAQLSDYNGHNLKCNGSNEGSITLTVSGGTPNYSYAWTGPGSYAASTKDVSGLYAGFYKVTITDANGCSLKDSFTLKQPDKLSELSTLSNYNGNNIKCNGSTEGSITLTISGGTPGYSYAWTGPGSYSASSKDISGLGAGMYKLTVTDANGCFVKDSLTLTAPDPLKDLSSLSNYNGSAIKCNGSSDGSIGLTVSGGTPNYSYAWTGPGSYSASTKDVSGLSAGFYKVTVTDVNGCFIKDSFTLTEPNKLSELSSLSNYNGSNIKCNGNNDGTITLTVSGGTPNYSYAWTGPGSYTASTKDVANLYAGVYYVTITDANGCSMKDSFKITEPNKLSEMSSLSNYNGSNIKCKGSNDGSISLALSGGTPAYSFAWEGPANFSASTKDVSGLYAGFYKVTITDANGCTLIDTFRLTESKQLSAISDVSNYNGSNIKCAGSTEGSISLSISGGTTPFSYIWTGPGNFTSTGKDVSNLKAGIYKVLISDANGCTLTDSFTLKEPAPITNVPAISDYNGHNVSCFGSSNGSINLTVSGGTAPFTYAWTGKPGSGYTANTKNISSLGAGLYKVIITDANGCTITDSFLITEPEKLTMTSEVSRYNGTNISCNGSNDGGVDIFVKGGTIPYSYAWTGTENYSSEKQDVNGLKAGSYKVVVTDANRCYISDSFILLEPPKLVVTATLSNYNGNNTRCNGSQDGAISLTVSGGTVPYTYQWTGPNNFSATSQNVTGIGAGTYVVVVTDMHGCTWQQSFTLTGPAQLTAEGAIKNATCMGNNGMITITVTGGTAPFSYLWSNGRTTKDLIAVPGGTYTLTVIDINGCTFTKEFVIGTTSDIGIDARVSEVLCHSGRTGSIMLTVIKGSAPYHYSWSNGDTTQNIRGLKAGTYTVTVTDRYGCTATSTFTVTEPDVLKISLFSPKYTGGYNISHFGLSDGSITLTVNGGKPDYIYSWSNENGTRDLSNVKAGFYTVTVTDANGCSVTDTMTLSQPLPLEMPTGFSPNGDGKNDLFVVHGLEAYPENNITIFNRWGNIVFATDDYRNDWNGTDNWGANLPEGTYFVVLKIENTDIVLKGYVDMRRY